MEADNKRIIPINIEEEMMSSYIDYSMSVIVSRALPDVRDGLKPVHRRVLYGMSELSLTAGAAYKKSARIVGECFVAGTRVLTDQGLLPIERVQRGDRVYTQHGIWPVTELYEMPERALVRVTLESGLSVTVTPDQPLKVLDENLTYSWKAARDLSDADHVVMRATYPDDLPYVSLPNWQGRPVRLTEDLAYLAGLFLSDGWLARDHGRFGFYSTERSVIERIRQTLHAHFGYEARVEDVSYEYQPQRGAPRTQAAWQIRIHAGALNAYLAEAFDIPAGTNTATKRVPACFWQSPRPVLAALLSGLFDGDGSIHRHRSQVHYGTISPALADDVQLILLHLGVLATRFVSDRSGGSVAGRSVARTAPFHAIEASGVYARRVAELLQLSHPEKQARLDRIREAPLKATKYDRVPYAAGPIFEELSAHHAGGGWYRDGDGNAFRRGIRYPEGSKIRYAAGLRDGYLGRTQLNDWGIREKLERIGSELAPFVTGVLDHDVHFIRVRSVEPAPAERTYDLQVAGPHEFVANGIVSHNCLGKYHPHGDSAVYDTMVRLAQDFSMRYPLVDGQGNFGSIDGDSPAAMRYTEARMTRLAEEMLRDINKETVDFTENFDGSLTEPTVMPAALPNLLLNGSDGIAVGMATKIPPHNLGEVIDGVIAYIDDNDIDLNTLMEHIPAPDFPTGGIIYGIGGVKSAYHTGRGRVVMRAKMHEEELRPGRFALVVTEIPYQVNKASLIEKIAHLVRDKRIEGISELRDESDREGMRIVVELRRDAVPLVTQNQLYKYTQCQQTFGVNMVALVGGRPRTITLKEAIKYYVEHRHEVVVRRTRYDLRKAEERAHILEGLTIALDHLDAVISIIRHSEDTDAARRNLMAGVFPARLTVEQRARLGLPTTSGSMFTLSEPQADAILALRLSRLTGMERQKIEDEYRDVLKEIERLQAILASEALRMQIIKDELLEVREKYNDARRTEIDYTGGGDIIIEDLIEDEQVVVTITHQGLIKRTSLTEYRAQGRGGVGQRGSGMRDEDYIEHLFVSSNHDYLLFFTDHGLCYWLRVYEIPEGNRTSKGRSIRNLIQIDPEDRVRTVLAVRKEQFMDEEFLNTHYVMMATRKGLVKKTALEAFSRPRADGIIAISIVDGDELLEAHLTDGGADVVLASSSGLSIRFREDDVRSMGRNTQGVRGIALGTGEQVVGMVVLEDAEHDVLAISANGYGKRSALDDYRIQGRGGKGIITMKTTSKTGPLVAIKSVVSRDDLMISTQNGIMIRMNVASISTLGRNTQGVRLISLRDSDAIADVTRLVIEEDVTAENGALPHADGDGAVDGPPEAATGGAAGETVETA